MNKIESWKLWLSPILCVYSCLLFLSVAPANPISACVVPLFVPAADVLGLSQSWELFAPDLDKANIQIYAFITFADGQTIMEALPGDEAFPNRALHFKLRQWLHDLVPRMSAIWPDTAVYVARLHQNAENPPTLVSLVCRWKAIEPPLNSVGAVTSQFVKAPKSGAFSFYTRAFRPEELQ